MASTQPTLMISAASADETIKLMKAHGQFGLALHIAERTVRSDIESYAEPVEHDGLKFYDTSRAQDGSGDPEDALTYVRLALAYIERAGDVWGWHLQRHISAPHLVRFVEKEQGNG